jgi:hypothetical protein
MKPLVIALSEKRVGEADGRGNLTNVQCKAIQNGHNKFIPAQ